MRPLSEGRGPASVCSREAEYFQRADERTRTADLLITSELFHRTTRASDFPLSSCQFYLLGITISEDGMELRLGLFCSFKP